MSDIAIDLTLDEVEQKASEVENKTNGKRERLSKMNFSIVKVFGKLSDSKNAPIFSIVDWDGYVKYDVRKWNEDMTVPYKGITFSKQEILKLLDVDLDRCVCSDTPRLLYEGTKAKAMIYERIVEFSFETIKDVVWNKEAVFVDWGYGKKVDLRKWSDDYKTCGKGICISFDEMKKLQTFCIEESK